jgi:hypothetical protein
VITALLMFNVVMFITETATDLMIEFITETTTVPTIKSAVSSALDESTSFSQKRSNGAGESGARS